VTETKLLRQ